MNSVMTSECLISGVYPPCVLLLCFWTFMLCEPGYTASQRKRGTPRPLTFPPFPRDSFPHPRSKDWWRRVVKSQCGGGGAAENDDGPSPVSPHIRPDGNT